MDSHQQKLRFLRSRGLKAGLGKAARVAASLGLALSLFGPLPSSLGQHTPTAEAGALEWDDIRPPMTDMKDTTATGVAGAAGAGYDALPAMGDVVHPLTVAPNGDVFVASGGNIYKSTDGGMSWRTATMPRQSAESTTDADPVPGFLLANVASSVVALSVSGKYPTDNVVFAAFASTTDVGRGAQDGSNGVLRSTDGGLTFVLYAYDGAADVNTGVALDGADGATALCDDSDDLDFDGDGACDAVNASARVNLSAVAPVLAAPQSPGGFGPGTWQLRSMAISPNFENSTGAGEFALGVANAAVASVLRISKTNVAAPTITNAPTVNSTTAACADGAGLDNAANTTWALAYAPNFSDNTHLARVRASGDSDASTAGNGEEGAYAEVMESGNFMCADGQRITAGVANHLLTAASIGFADSYTSTALGGIFWVGISGTTADNVYKHLGGGGFTNLNVTQATPAPVDMPISGLVTKGATGDTLNVYAARHATATQENVVFRSTNGGDNWTTAKDLDGDKSKNVGGGFNRVALGGDYATSGTVYGTLGGNLGGVVKSTNRGNGWSDLALTNQQYQLTSWAQADGATYFAVGRAGGTACTGGTPCSVFKTTNRGQSATFIRADRRVDGAAVTVPAGFAGHSTVYIRRSGSLTSGQILKSTDGGVVFDTTSADPGDKGITTLSCASALLCWAGTTEGLTWITNNGGGSWSQAVTDIGQSVQGYVRSPDFAADNTIFAYADGPSGATEIWRSTDGGLNFTMVGMSSGAWGTSSGAGSLIVSPNYKDDKMAFFRPPLNASENDIYRINTGASANWQKLGAPDGLKAFGTASLAAAAGIGDGLVLYMLGDADSVTTGVGADAVATANNIIWRTYYPNTVDSTSWSKLVVAAATPLAGITSYTRVAGAEGMDFDSVTRSGRAIIWTDTTSYRAQVALSTPPANSNVPSNVGQNGIPVTLTWSNVERVHCWAVQVALDLNFTQFILDGSTAPGPACAAVTDNGEATNPSLTLISGGTISGTTANASLVQGSTYYWRVRAQMVGPTAATAVVAPGPWSKPGNFAVSSQGAPSSPEPQLPADGSTMPNLGPTNLSWNNPAGTVQYQVQVIPLNQDGPGIDLIIGDPAMVASASYTVQPPILGSGNYIILPGATYNWRVRTTTKSGSISTTDPSWGPWSAIRTYKTPRPTASSITLNPVTPSATPTVSWKDSRIENFYYEVQLSQDRTFTVDPASATAAVYWNLQHGGVSDPLNSWKTPPGLTLEKGKTYYWRVRQRVQATANGPDEVGVGWTATANFMVP